MSRSSNSILRSFRLYRKLEIQYLADELGLTTEEYENLESFSTTINSEIVGKLSELYQAPQQVFIDNTDSIIHNVSFSHCHFERSNGFLNHLHKGEERLASKEEHIRTLLLEVNQLYLQNNELIRIVNRLITP